MSKPVKITQVSPHEMEAMNEDRAMSDIHNSAVNKLASEIREVKPKNRDAAYYGKTRRLKEHQELARLHQSRSNQFYVTAHKGGIFDANDANLETRREYKNN